MNPDRALVLQFLRGGGKPLAITSNPLARDLRGWIHELDAARGTALLLFEPPAQFVQGAQVLQGGIVATLLDFAMAFALHARLEEEKPFATASLTVSLLRAATAPARYLAEGRIVRMGSRLIFAEASTRRDGDARVIASASAVMSFVDP